VNGERLEVLGLADQDCSTERDEVPGYLKVFKAGPSVLGPLLYRNLRKEQPDCQQPQAPGWSRPSSSADLLIWA